MTSVKFLQNVLGLKSEKLWFENYEKYRKQTCDYQRGKIVGEKDKVRAWDQQMQITVYKINNKGLLYRTGSYIQCLLISCNKL